MRALTLEPTGTTNETPVKKNTQLDPKEDFFVTSPIITSSKIPYGAKFLIPNFPRLIPGITLSHIALGLLVSEPATNPIKKGRWLFEGKNPEALQIPLQYLTTEEKDVLDLRHVQGLPRKLISQVTALSPSLVNRRLNCALNKIAELSIQLQEGKLPTLQKPTTDKVVTSEDALRALEEFDKVYETYQERLYNRAYRLMGNPQDAEDIMQETFIRAQAALPNVTGKLSVSSWLYTITTNLCLDELRKRRRIQLEDADGLPEIIGSTHPMVISNDTPESETLRKEEKREAKEKVDSVLIKLPPMYRTCLILFEYQDKSCQEIAEVIGKTQSAAKSLLYRARESFRQAQSKLEGAN